MSTDLHALARQHGGQVFDGGRRALLPGPGHSRKDRSLSVLVGDDGRLIVNSFSGDGWQAARDYLQLDEGDDRRPANRGDRDGFRRDRDAADAVQRAKRHAWCGKVWDETALAAGSPVQTYLRSRGLQGQVPRVLRYHPAAPLNYGRTSTSPAMVALVQDGHGEAVGLHVTALTPGGLDKADMREPRRMYGAVKGAAVRLYPATDELAVAEGVETALSFTMLTGISCWAAGSSSGVAALVIPPGVGRLVIAADGDSAGMNAAHTLAGRAGHQARVEIAPALVGRDWNDEIRGMAQ